MNLVHNFFTKFFVSDSKVRTRSNLNGENARLINRHWKKG